MKIFLIFFIFFLFNNCSFNKDSEYWTEDVVIKKNDQNVLSKILKKSDDIRSMTLEEYKIYIDDFTKKSKYPDISK